MNNSALRQRIITKRYFVTYVTTDGQIISNTCFGISQKPNESDNHFNELSQGEIAIRLSESISSTIANYQAIINFWEIKKDIIYI